MVNLATQLVLSEIHKQIIDRITFGLDKCWLPLIGGDKNIILSVLDFISTERYGMVSNGRLTESNEFVKAIRWGPMLKLETNIRHIKGPPYEVYIRFIGPIEFEKASQRASRSLQSSMLLTVTPTF
jgi:hypothetical protein